MLPADYIFYSCMKNIRKLIFINFSIILNDFFFIHQLTTKVKIYILFCHNIKLVKKLNKCFYKYGYSGVSQSSFFIAQRRKNWRLEKKKLEKGLDGILDANYFSLNYCLEKILNVCDFFRRQSSPCKQSIATICNIVLVFSQVINNYIYNNNKLG